MNNQSLAKEIAGWICERKGVVRINGSLYQRKIGYYAPLTRQQIKKLVRDKCREIAKKYITKENENE